jgi:hypothetical protein
LPVVFCRLVTKSESAGAPAIAERLSSLKGSCTDGAPAERARRVERSGVELRLLLSYSRTALLRRTRRALQGSDGRASGGRRQAVLSHSEGGGLRPPRSHATVIKKQRRLRCVPRNHWLYMRAEHWQASHLLVEVASRHSAKVLARSKPAEVQSNLCIVQKNYCMCADSKRRKSLQLKRSALDTLSTELNFSRDSGPTISTPACLHRVSIDFPFFADPLTSPNSHESRPPLRVVAKWPEKGLGDEKA